MNPRYIDKRLISRTIASRSSSNNIESSSNYSGSDFPYPSCESLKDCEARAYSFWLEVIAPRVKVSYYLLIQWLHLYRHLYTHMHTHLSALEISVYMYMQTIVQM